jgi:hypothetical protein
MIERPGAHYYTGVFDDISLQNMSVDDAGQLC